MGTAYYYILSPEGDSCGHRHGAIDAPALRRCARVFHGGVPVVWHVDAKGIHARVPRSQLAQAGLLAPPGKPGPKPGAKPRVEQASPLYHRLSADQRARFERVAKRHGMELGAYALFLLEHAAQVEAESDAFDKAFGAPSADLTACAKAAGIAIARAVMADDK